MENEKINLIERFRIASMSKKKMKEELEQLRTKEKVSADLIQLHDLTDQNN